MNQIYFVTVGNKDELQVIRQLRPKRLLVSYFYFRTKGLQWLIEQIGYKPIIIVDSGAFSAHTKGKNISPLDYLKFLDDNEGLYSEFIALDVLGDPVVTQLYYEIMRARGYFPIPVIHYGRTKVELQCYLDRGHTRIALGGCVPIRDKSKVVSWVKTLQTEGVTFHLLGSSSKQIMDNVEMESFDSSTWVMKASFGKPRTVKGTKLELMKHNMKTEMEEYL